MRPPLTARQSQILDCIASSIIEQGYPPAIREIADHMGLRSSNAVRDHLVALERKGYITRTRYKSRAITLVGMPGPYDDLVKAAEAVADPHNFHAQNIHDLRRALANLRTTKCQP